MSAVCLWSRDDLLRTGDNIWQEQHPCASTSYAERLVDADAWARRRSVVLVELALQMIDLLRRRAEIQAVTDGSDDGFLHARGFIVALGQDYYTAVAGNPQLGILDCDCESMCYFFAHLHSDLYGSWLATGSGITRESCSNPSGWTFA
jgi:hypothetical protein